MELAIRHELPAGTAFDDAVTRATEALATEGFGVLTTIDLQAKMLEKLDRQMGRYVILGACNPALAWDAVGAVPEIGVLLPCNVIVREDPAAGGAVVLEAMNPLAALGLIDDDTVRAVATDADARLRRALAALS
ncbi:MAG: DUF302 domain-containing protein [Thermoplasmatota archaeon]